MKQAIAPGIIHSNSNFIIDSSKYSEKTISKFKEEIAIIEDEFKILGFDNYFKNGYNDINLEDIYIYSKEKFSEINRISNNNDLNNYLSSICNNLYYKEADKFNNSILTSLKTLGSVILEHNPLDYTKLTDTFSEEYLNKEENIIYIKKVIYLKYLQLRFKNACSIIQYINTDKYKTNSKYKKYIFLNFPNFENIKIPLDETILSTDISISNLNLKFNIMTSNIYKKDDISKINVSYYDIQFTINDLDNIDYNNLFFIDYESIIEAVDKEIKEENNSGKDVIIKLLETYYPGEYSINSMSDYDSIIIRFKDFEITNSENKKHNIKDFFLRFKINKKYDKFVSSELYGARTTFSLEEYESSYFHSHKSSNDTIGGFSRMCLGSTVLSQFMMIFLEKIENELFESFLIQLDNYVRWESIEGVPYRYIRNIKLKNVNNNYEDEIYNLVQSSSFIINCYKYILNKNDKLINIKEVTKNKVNTLLLEESVELEKQIALYLKEKYYSSEILKSLNLSILNVFKYKDVTNNTYISLLPIDKNQDDNASSRELKLIERYDNKDSEVIFNGEYVKINIIKNHSLKKDDTELNSINYILESNKESLVVDRRIFDNFMIIISKKLNLSFKDNYIEKLKKEYFINYDNNIK